MHTWARPESPWKGREYSMNAHRLIASSLGQVNLHRHQILTVYANIAQASADGDKKAV